MECGPRRGREERLRIGANCEAIPSSSAEPRQGRNSVVKPLTGMAVINASNDAETVVIEEIGRRNVAQHFAQRFP